MNDKGFVTKGSADYFAERGAKIQARIDEAKNKIDTIEARVRTEILEIQTERSKLIDHLRGAVAARDALATKREAATKLVSELQGVITICDNELPALDKMLDLLSEEGERADNQLEDAEKSRHRQLRKHERTKTRYEGRKVRLELRQQILAKSTNGMSTESKENV